MPHSGEAIESRKRFETLSPYDRDSMIEFLKSLQVLPPGVSSLVVDDRFKAREWPPKLVQTSSVQ